MAIGSRQRYTELRFSTHIVNWGYDSDSARRTTHDTTYSRTDPVRNYTPFILFCLDPLDRDVSRTGLEQPSHRKADRRSGIEPSFVRTSALVTIHRSFITGASRRSPLLHIQVMYIGRPHPPHQRS